MLKDTSHPKCHVDQSAADQASLKALQRAHHSSSPNLMAGLNRSNVGYNRKYVGLQPEQQLNRRPFILSMHTGVPCRVWNFDQFCFPAVLLHKVRLHRGHSMMAANQKNAQLCRGLKRTQNCLDRDVHTNCPSM